MDLVAFEAFLKAAFSSGELRRWIFSLPGGRSVLDEMPGESASLAEQAHAAAMALDRQGSFGPALFASLRAARENRVAEIDALERSWRAGAGPAPAPAKPAATGGASQQVSNLGPVGQQFNISGGASFHLGGPEAAPAAPGPAAPRPAAAEKMKILFLAANPIETSRLTLDREFRGIRERLQMAGQRDRFDLDSAWAVRTGDLRQELLNRQPNIVHFSGHATLGGIVLEGRTGGLQRVAGAALASLFSLFTDSVRVVVLNACYSDEQAQAIAEHIPVVVGMVGPVDDEAGVLFAEGFYQALGGGRTVADAVKLGRVAYELEGITVTATPQIRCRDDIDPASFRLTGKP